MTDGISADKAPREPAIEALLLMRPVSTAACLVSLLWAAIGLPGLESGVTSVSAW